MKNRFFTTIDLLISISIITALTGMFLLNYRMQGKIRDLTDASHIITQRIRKAQNMAMAQSKLPLGCPAPMPLPPSYGLHFEIDDDYFDIFADKDGGNDYDLSGAACTCNGAIPTNECIERVFLPITVMISDIRINGVPTPSPGWINFLLKDMSVKMKGGDQQTFEIRVCIKSDCATNTKRVIINNKGMIEIQ